MTLTLRNPLDGEPLGTPVVHEGHGDGRLFFGRVRPADVPEDRWLSLTPALEVLADEHGTIKATAHIDRSPVKKSKKKSKKAGRKAEEESEVAAQVADTSLVGGTVRKVRTPEPEPRYQPAGTIELDDAVQAMSGVVGFVELNWGRVLWTLASRVNDGTLHEQFPVPQDTYLSACRFLGDLVPVDATDRRHVEVPEEVLGYAVTGQRNPMPSTLTVHLYPTGVDADGGAVLQPLDVTLSLEVHAELRPISFGSQATDRSMQDLAAEYLEIAATLAAPYFPEAYADWLADRAEHVAGATARRTIDEAALHRREEELAQAAEAVDAASLALSKAGTDTAANNLNAARATLDRARRLHREAELNALRSKGIEQNMDYYFDVAQANQEVSGSWTFVVLGLASEHTASKNVGSLLHTLFPTGNQPWSTRFKEGNAGRLGEWLAQHTTTQDHVEQLMRERREAWAAALEEVRRLELGQDRRRGRLDPPTDG